MSLLQKKYGRFFNNKVFDSLFVIWFLLFPFDASVLPVSIGFMTIYPFLILTVFLFFYSFLGNPVTNGSTADRYAMCFFIFWIVYALTFYPFVKGKENAFYEIRNLGMMGITVWMLFRTLKLKGYSFFLEKIFQMSVLLFILLSSFAFFEYFTGIHFCGKFTGKLWHLPAGVTTYAPVFVYDNPNTFLPFLFGTAMMIFVSKREVLRRSSVVLVILFLLFFFSVAADSRFGKIASLIFFISWLCQLYLYHDLKKFKKYFLWLVVPAMGFAWCFLSKPLYFGPMWKNGEHYIIPSLNPVNDENGKPVFYSSDSLVKKYGEQKIIDFFRQYEMRGTDHSVTIRKNLLKNGWYLLKISHFLGVGPGQFRWYHDQKMVPFPVSTLNSPHDGPMEILSQYGLPVFVPFVILFFMYWLMTFKKRKDDRGFFIMITSCFLVLIILSDMSSAWLILDIGWILMPVLWIAASQPSNANHG